MSDNHTQEMPDSRSFEERVFARFDTLDVRITTLEDKVDSRLRDTRPIWEAVQADVTIIKGDVKEIKRDLKTLNNDLLRVRGELQELDERVGKLEPQSTS